MTSKPDMQKFQWVQDTLYVFGGKWRFRILFALCLEPKRFSELEKEIERISPRMLAKELRELEINDIVEKRTVPERPKITFYALTAYAANMDNILDIMSSWGRNHREHIMHRKARPQKFMTDQPQAGNSRSFH